MPKRNTNVTVKVGLPLPVTTPAHIHLGRQRASDSIDEVRLDMVRLVRHKNPEGVSIGGEERKDTAIRSG